APIFEWRVVNRLGDGIYEPIPLLNYALRVRNHDISLMLANDPRTIVEQSAHRDTGTPLEMAQNGGMSDVAAVIARRMAELTRDAAARWDARAKELSPAPEA